MERVLLRQLRRVRHARDGLSGLPLQALVLEAKVLRRRSEVVQRSSARSGVLWLCVVIAMILTGCQTARKSEWHSGVSERFESESIAVAGLRRAGAWRTSRGISARRRSSLALMHLYM